MDKELHELAKRIVELQKEAVKQVLAYWKPEAEIGRASCRETV